MFFGIFLATLVVTVLLIALDAARKIRLTHPVWLLVLLVPVTNVPVVLWLLFSAGGGWAWACCVPLFMLVLYMVLRLHVFPFRDGKRMGIRLKAMMGGRTMVRAATLALLWEALLLVALWQRPGPFTALPTSRYIGNLVYAVVFVFALYFGGAVRMLLTSRRLSVVYRVLILCTWFLPVVNIIVLHRCCRLVYEEYDFACYKADLRALRAESDICRTRYPLVMVHGVLFRDLRFFNYWGRVPRELLRLGATVYYGNQEAVGTVVTNAADLVKKVKEVLEETGCEKVNIIAHSKGGLDSRYAISRLGLAPSVASLTTISTPHRGCGFVDKACNLPEGLYRFIAKRFDNTFRRMGDKQPDFYTATRQFSTAASTQFNAEVPDAEGVYYQSYMTRMKNALSDSLLAATYLLIQPLEGPNDGLVAVESAKWGAFRGLLEAPGRRGISHGDIIDLKREDIKGFDVVETYVDIVADLKAMGY